MKLLALIFTITLFSFRYPMFFTQDSPEYCEEPATYTHRTIANGNWNSASTWEGGVVPPLGSTASKTILVTHTVAYNSTYNPNNNTTLVIKEGGQLTVSSMQIEKATTILIKNARLNVQDDLQQKNTNAKICGIYACLKVTGNYQIETGAKAYFISSGLEIYGNFQSSGSVGGSDLRIWVRNGNLQNSGTWTGYISYYRTSGGISGISTTYHPVAPSSQAIIQETIQTCTFDLMPVTLLSLTVQKKANVVLLNWTTSNEQNNKGFEVQHSEDGQNWKPLGYIFSKAVNGNSNHSLSYSFTDYRLLQGKQYYRLSQTDLNGRSTYSDIISLYSDTEKSGIQIYPQPVQSQATIKGLQPGDRLAVYNVLGELITSFKANSNMHKLDMSRWPAAMYSVVITDTKGINKGLYKMATQP